MSLVGNRGVDRKRKMPLMINDASQLESAKMQKFNPSLSIHPGGQGYKVTSVSCTNVFSNSGHVCTCI